MSTFPPGAIFCRTCGYCLYALTVNRCPECGRECDPANPKTFRTRPPRTWPRRLLLWGGIPLLILAVGYAGLLGWLYWGWKAEAGARGLAVGQYDNVHTRSVLPSVLSRLLLGDCRQWQERVDTLVLHFRPLSPEEIHSIAACHRLRGLVVDGVPLKGEDVAALCQCRELENLVLSNAGVAGRDVAPVSELLHLKTLAIVHNEQLDDAALPAIGKLRELKVLHLGDTVITDGGLSHLSGLANLEVLYLWNCANLTDAAVPHLSRLTGLKELYLNRTRLTGAGIAKLRSALPECLVVGP